MNENNTISSGQRTPGPPCITALTEFAFGPFGLPRLGKFRLWTSLTVWLALFGLALSECSASSPFVVTPAEAEKEVKRLPSYAKFSFSGLVFYSHKLYASSGFGLLEYEGGALRQVYRWNRRDSDVEGPWLDSANRLLWVWVPGGGQVASFDGKKWTTMRMPEPKQGLSRGNELEGFRGIGNSQTFWLEGAWHAWAWSPKHLSWSEERNPPVLADVGAPILRRLLPTEEHLHFIMMRDNELLYSDEELQQKQKGDVVYYFEKRWIEVTNISHFVFFAEETIAAAKAGYIRTRRGDILEVTDASIRRLSTPGKCEAITTTASGSLLACFHNLGVYELSNGWERRFPTPYPTTEGEHWVHLAQSDREIALSVSPIPRLVGDKTVYDSSAALWVFDGQKLQRATFPRD